MYKDKARKQSDHWVSSSTCGRNPRCVVQTNILLTYMVLHVREAVGSRAEESLETEKAGQHASGELHGQGGPAVQPWLYKFLGTLLLDRARSTTGISGCMSIDVATIPPFHVIFGSNRRTSTAIRGRSCIARPVAIGVFTRI